MTWGRGSALSGRVLDELLVKMGVLPAVRDQLAMCPALDHATLVDHQDAVGVEDGAEAMSDDESRAAVLKKSGGADLEPICQHPDVRLAQLALAVEDH